MVEMSADWVFSFAFAEQFVVQKRATKAESKSVIPTNSPDDPCEHSVTLSVEAKHKPAEPHFRPDASSSTTVLMITIGYVAIHPVFLLRQ